MKKHLPFVPISMSAVDNKALNLYVFEINVVIIEEFLILLF